MKGLIMLFAFFGKSPIRFCQLPHQKWGAIFPSSHHLCLEYLWPSKRKAGRFDHVRCWNIQTRITTTDHVIFFFFFCLVLLTPQESDGERERELFKWAKDFSFMGKSQPRILLLMAVFFSCNMFSFSFQSLIHLRCQTGKWNYFNVFLFFLHLADFLLLTFLLISPLQNSSSHLNRQLG